MSHIQLEKKRGSRDAGRQRERRREGKDGGVGESRRHVNRYMLETQSVFIYAVMHRGDGRGDEERNMVTDYTWMSS